MVCVIHQVSSDSEMLSETQNTSIIRKLDRDQKILSDVGL